MLRQVNSYLPSLKPSLLTSSSFYRFGVPANFLYCCRGLCATDLWFTSSLIRVCCTHVQPSSSGIVAGETTQNTVENPAVQEQVIVQEIPRRCVTHSAQRRLRSASHHPSFDLTGRDLTEYMRRSSPSAVHFHYHRRVGDCSAPQVVGSFSAFEEFDAPVYNRIHQEQIVTGMTTSTELEIQLCKNT